MKRSRGPSGAARIALRTRSCNHEGYSSKEHAMRVERWRWRVVVLGAVICTSISGCVTDGALPQDPPAAAGSELASTRSARVSAAPFATTSDLNFGVAGDASFVFVTQPLARRVLVLDRASGRTLGQLPPPPDGFLLPFTVRVPRPDHLVVLDPGGFPSPTTPSIARVFDYEVRERSDHGHGHGHRDHDDRGFEAELVRTVS